jgi:aryl-alcohol dehydrogenase-like predicted oxidoreductase
LAIAKARNRPLKVFQAQVGFYDTVVAAPSQAAALRAWGIHQNLFSDGQASVCSDARAVKAALAHPETPLRRAVGSQDAFCLEPTGLPIVPDGPKKARSAPETKSEPAKPPADRFKLDAAERALRKLDDDRNREEAKLRRRQDELDAETAAARTNYVAARKAATAAVVGARTAYREAGGAE